MSYTLQAIIGRSAVLNLGGTNAALKCVDMAQGLTMIPLVDEVRKRYGIGLLPLTDEAVETLPEPIRALCVELFPSGDAAYLEAEIFGGMGMQASVLFKDGVVCGAITVSEDAINQALKVLGVSRNRDHDEFDALDLGRHRDTEMWVA